MKDESVYKSFFVVDERVSTNVSSFILHPSSFILPPYPPASGIEFAVNIVQSEIAYLGKVTIFAAPAR
jgi:hypothetical protein